MNTNQYSQAFQTQVPMSSTDYYGGGAATGLSFQDFGSSQDNYLQFTEFSQVRSHSRLIIYTRSFGATAGHVPL
jgi:hypothetical protein